MMKGVSEIGRSREFSGSGVKEWAVGRKNSIGLMICVALFFAGFAVHDNMALYFNLSAVLIVIGGTFGAMFISFRADRFAVAYKVLKSSYRKPVPRPGRIIRVLVELSVKSKLQGVLSLQEDEEETTVMFLRSALGYLVDGYSMSQLRDMLTTEMYFFKKRRQEVERFLMTMADICPSFGLVGSVVGLIGMLGGVGDTSVILAMIPIALTSTLYGIIFANFFFMPFAVKVRERTSQELLLQKIIMEGVIAIGKEQHPRVLEKKLKSFLTPSERNGHLVSLKMLHEKFQNEFRDKKAANGSSRKTADNNVTRISAAGK